MSAAAGGQTRLLAVSHLATRGGAQKCLTTLSSALDPGRFEVHALLPGDGPLAADLEAAGARVHLAPLAWWVGVESRWNWMNLRFRSGLSRRVEGVVELIRRERIDLVLTNSSVTIEGGLAAAAAGVPHLVHVLELLSRDPGLRPSWPLAAHYSLLHRLAAALVVPSCCVAEEIRRHQSDADPLVVPTGIERLEREEHARSKAVAFGIDEGDPVIGFVGELWARKGLGTLIESVPLVLAEHPRAHFVVAGADRGERAPALRRALDSGVAERVRFLGPRSDALTVLATSDLFVLPSLSDPFPVVALEAMALGVPSVVTRSGGAAEMHRDGETGAVVEPGSASELADAIRRLLRDPAAARALGAAAQRRARAEFSPALYAERFEEALRRARADSGAPERQLQREAAASEVRSGVGILPVSVRALAAEILRALAGRARRGLAARERLGGRYNDASGGVRGRASRRP